MVKLRCYHAYPGIICHNHYCYDTWMPTLHINFIIFNYSNIASIIMAIALSR